MNNLHKYKTMNPAKFISIALLAFAFTACTSKTDPKEELQEQIIAVHDEVMPKMGELRKVMKQLEAKADSIIGADPEAMQRANELLNLASDISNANESMMIWMRNFDPTMIKTETDGDKVMAYLNDQMQKIEKVRDDMLNSLTAGKASLAK